MKSEALPRRVSNTEWGRLKAEKKAEPNFIQRKKERKRKEGKGKLIHQDGAAVAALTRRRGTKALKTKSGGFYLNKLRGKKKTITARNFAMWEPKPINEKKRQLSSKKKEQTTGRNTFQF